MKKEERFNLIKENYKNFLKVLTDAFCKTPEDKVSFEFTLSAMTSVNSSENLELAKFSVFAIKSIFHYGDELISEIKKVYDENVPNEYKTEDNWE